MKKNTIIQLVAIIAVMIVICALWALPLWACANLVLWLFHIPFRWTLWQTFGVCLLITVIRNLIFSNKEGK